MTPKTLIALVGLSLLTVPLGAGAADTVRVRLATNLGAIVLELDRGRAPITVANFLTYVEDGFYDGTIFHRVLGDFVIQGGGFTEEMRQKRTNSPVRNESDNGLSNERGTVAMARTQDPHSATSQFFINVVDNPMLDHGAQGEGAWGYAVFGRVVGGMDVVDEIRTVPTGRHGMFQDVPQSPVIIESAHVEDRDS